MLPVPDRTTAAVLLLLGVAFVAGVLTVASPCILPVLPIVLSSGATGSPRRTVGVGAGFIASFTFSAALLAAVIAATGLPPGALRVLAIAVILAMGAILLVPPLRDRLEALLARSQRFVPQWAAPRSGGGFGSGVLIGVSTGLLCAPCAGPVLTAVATLAATNRLSGGLLLVAAAYATGIAVPLTVIGLGARRVTGRLKRTARAVPTIAGAMLLVSGVAIAMGLDQRAQVWAAQAAGWTNALQSIEETPAVVAQLARLRGEDLQSPPNLPRLTNEGPAAPFVGLTNWMNSPPLTLQELRGKVVLVDFWTYSCVNCVRELPHLEAWYQQYATSGLVVVGIHTPEFAFEHDPHNVAMAVKRQGLTFPVALDNQLATWNAYRNLAWPEMYLVDATGTVQYIHVGEGDYPTTEAAIRTLLTEAGNAPAAGETSVPDTSPQVFTITPETYLGADNLHSLASPQNAQVGVAMNYTLPATLSADSVAFQGNWTLEPEYVQANSAGALALHFYADRVYLVLTPQAAGQTATLLLDGKRLADDQAGSDVHGGVLTLDVARLYDLVNLHGPPAQHQLQVQFATPGVQAYSFTFG